jgi:DNA mismatch repair protein MutL
VIVRTLPETLINQIAAGEVVERPASVVRELVENAIDAGATDIRINLNDGGISFIQIADNGLGMHADDLALAIDRHATSKLPDENLNAIRSMGFRGEALPSIGAVARLEISTRTQNDPAGHGWQINVEGGIKSPIKPLQRDVGTTVTVRDLFFATPARLKFLKSPVAEYRACLDSIERLALAFPYIGFHLQHNGKHVLRAPASDATSPAQALAQRAEAIMARDFMHSHLLVETENLFGLISHPTYTMGVSTTPYLFINQRPIRDRALAQMIRLAYQDLIPRDRHPVVALHLLLPPEHVDMNVHPAKAEVRFRDPNEVRTLLRHTLQHRLAQIHSDKNTLEQSSVRIKPASSTIAAPARHFATPLFHAPSARQLHLSEQAQAPVIADATHTSPELSSASFSLGAPLVQLFDTYIIALNDDGAVLVDQHAAHERLVYEELKQALQNKSIESQMLLLPETIDLPARAKDALLHQQEALANLGLEFDDFGERTIILRQVPALLGERVDWQTLLSDLANLAAEEMNSNDFLQRQLDKIAATMACYGSVRAGRRLNQAEMAALLRKMEETPNSLTCNHGRPTAITLDKVQLEKLFARR